MKKLLLFFMGVLVFTSMYSQSQLQVFPDWTSTTGSQNFYVKNVTKTFGAYVYVVGATLNGSGNYDCLVAKYNQGGVLQWEKQYDGLAHNQDVATAVFVDASGNVFITGETVADSVYHTSDVITIKYNSSGVQQWATRYNGTGSFNDAGADITVDATTGNVFVAGGSYNAAGTPNTDMIALCYNSSGVQQWVGRYDGASHLDDVATRIAINSTTVTITGAVQTGTTTYQYGVIVYAIGTGVQNSATITTGGTSGIATVTDMVKDASGNIYICGSQSITGHGQDYCLIKISAAMAIAWTVNYNGSASLDDIANSVRVDASGNVFVTGSAQNTSHGKDYVTLKYNSSGTLQWTQTYNDALNGDDEATAMSIDNSGNIYVTGYTTTAINQADYYTIKYNTSGTQQWTADLDGAAHLIDKAASIAVDTTGLIVVTGQSQLTATTYQYLTVRYIEKNIITPTDYNSETPAQNFGYYKNGGQLLNTSHAAISSEKYYTNNTSPKYYINNTSFSFVCAKIDTIHSTMDTMQRVDVTLKNSSAAAKVYPLEERADYISYFLAHIPNGVTEIHADKKLVMTDIYTNIDLMYSSNQNGFKEYFIVKPGGSPTAIDVLYTGATSIVLNGTTHYLSINTAVGGGLTFDRPTVYQLDASNTIIPITGWNADFVSSGTNSYKFNIGAYDNTKALIIEVDQGNSTASASAIGNLDWSTLYGGLDGDAMYDVTTDPLGNSYVSGVTVCSDFPITTGVYQNHLDSLEDAVVVKFDATTQLNTYATYYGGTGNDRGLAISVDASGQVYVAGYTYSYDFPTVSPIETYSYGEAGFVFKLNATGTARGWATTFGNGGVEFNDIALDHSGNVYAVGFILSGAITTHAQTGTTTYSTGQGLILKLSTGGIEEWASHYGGTYYCRVMGVAIDQSDNVFLTGATRDVGFVQSNPNWSHAYGGPLSDAFITKLNTANNLAWSNFYGGNDAELGQSLAINASGDVAFVGETVSSSGFPVTNGSTYGGSVGLSSGDPWGDAFIGVFDNSGHYKFGTYFGSTGNEGGFGIAYDSGGKLYITGYTTSSTNTFLIPSPNATGTYAVSSLTGVNDCYVACFNTSYARIWGTYFGGNDNENATGMAISVNNKLFIDGVTTSYGIGTPFTPFPLVDLDPTGHTDYFQGALNGNNIATGASDGFVSRFDLSPLTGVEEMSENDSEIGVYPNPSSGEFNIIINKLENKRKVTINVYDVVGKLIHSEIIKDPQQTVVKMLNLSYLSSGLYMLNIQVDDKTYNKKIIKN